MKFEISELDTKRFGMKIAKVKEFSKGDMKPINLACEKDHVQMAILRIPTSDLPTAQALEENRAFLMDTIVYYKFDYAKKQSHTEHTSIDLRTISGDGNAANVIKEIAQAAFAGYMGHYHSDPKLDRQQCDAAYIDWAYRSCMDSGVADAVLCPEYEGIIAGFGTVKIHTPILGEVILAGVSPSYQKHGFYRTIILGSMEWLHNKGCSQIILSTQITNIAVQKVWARCGFEMDHSFYTYHKWFDDNK